MELTVTESVSLDGVMQGLGGPDEDRRGGFERGGWQIPLSDEEVFAFLNDVYARADAFLFGRRTYEIFAGSWGLMKDPSQSPFGQALHSRRKYVASSTLTEPRWADTTVIAGEVAAVSELKAEPGGELQVHGSGVKVVKLRFQVRTEVLAPLIVFQLDSGCSPRAAACSSRLTFV